MTETVTASSILSVPKADLDDLRDRVRRTRWAPDWPIAAETSGGAVHQGPRADGALDNTAVWGAGTDPALLRRLADRWVNGFDWDAQQREINALPWSSAVVDGTPLAYLQFNAETPGALPIVLTNGWPSTAVEMVGLAQRLSEPSRFGGSASDALTVIVPALPGFPFSPQRPDHNDQTHELWHTLMTEHLGFTKYGAHGGDLGAGITSRLAQAHPEAVVGIHLLAIATALHVDPDSITAEEQVYIDAVDQWRTDEGGYQHQQSTRPLTLAPALNDSPVGLLSWIVEKHRAWSDCDGDVSARFSDDYLLTVTSLYWFTNSISTSFRPYWEYNAGFTPRIERVEVPTAIALFPADISQPPRSWAERLYPVVRYNRMTRGGHFAPHEEPELLATDISEFFKQLQAA
jgi:pimeloyl-ACP methyl ester carboxylesterase